MAKNIYIEALEYADSKSPKGITYNDLKEHLIELGHIILSQPKTERMFIIWFYKSFFFGDNAESLEDFSRNNRTLSLWHRDKQFLDNEQWIRPETYFKYIDYLEMRQARESSEQANDNALKSINLAKQSIDLTKESVMLTGRSTNIAEKSLNRSTWAIIITGSLAAVSIAIQLYNTFR